MTLSDISEKIKETKSDDIKLYFITRALKANCKKSSKVLDKYLFKAYQVDVDTDIKNFLFGLTQEKLEFVIKQNYEMLDYDIITDDEEHLFTYSTKNKVFSFSDVVLNQLTDSPEKMQSVIDITSNGDELWAYCVGFNEVENSKWIYTFRKIQPGKIAIDQKDNIRSIKDALRTVFNTSNQKLELLQGQVINLDKKIDCIYYEDTFYVLQKVNFEQLIGLQEEYRKQAKEIVNNLKDTKIIKGIEIIDSKIETSTGLHKKLVKIARLGNYQNLDISCVKNMKKVAKKFGVNLKTTDDNLLVIEDDKDIDNVLKMLGDYYKSGEVSGKKYGTFSGREIKNISEK